MNKPKCRAALWSGLASATLAALAPLPAHAQLQTYPGAGMAMPRAMLPPGMASGAPGYGAGMGNARSMPAMPVPMLMPTMPQMRTYAPAFSGRPAYGQSNGLGYGQSYGFGPREGNSPSPSVPASSGVQLEHRHLGSDRGFFGNGSAPTVTEPARPESNPPRVISRILPTPLNRIISPVRPFEGTGRLGSMSEATNPPVVYNPGNTYIYAPQAPVTTLGGPALLGGFYYGGYCDTNYGSGTYPSVYSVYTGFPAYIYNPGVVYQTLGYQPTYITAPLPFDPPQYQVTYNQTNYYVTNEAQAAKVEDGGEPAKQAVHQAFPADSYQAAFADIERAWSDGNLDLIKNHLRNSDTKVSVFLGSKYKYSLASADFGQITRDAFDRLDTVSFRLTRLRKAKTGDVTAFGKHVYRVASSGDKAAGASPDNTVPFDSTTPDAVAPAESPAAGVEKTVYVSYTLRHGGDGWYIIAVNSSADPLVKEAE